MVAVAVAVVFLGDPGQSAIAVGVGVLRVEANGLIEVGNGAVEFAFVVPGIPARDIEADMVVIYVVRR
jgi:hypothetical protein